MTCDELDDLRDKGKRRPAALPSEAREHLRTCERCRALQALWEIPDVALDVPEGIEAGITEKIIYDLKPVSPLPSDLVLVSWLLLLAAVGVAIGAAWLGSAGWHALAAWQAAIMFSLLSGALVLVAHVVIRQIIPGALQRISPVLAMGAVFASLLVAVGLLFPFKLDPKFVPTGLACWERGVLTAAGAACLFFPILRRGVAMSPLRLGAATGCLSGLAGLTVLEIYCPYLDRGHISVWHVGAALTATLIGSVAAALWHRGRESPVA